MIQLRRDGYLHRRTKMPEKPTTVKKMVDQIWFAVYGTNGSIGIVKRLERLENRPHQIWLILHGAFTLILLGLVFLFGSGVL